MGPKVLKESLGTIMSMMKEGTPFSIKHLQGKQPQELTEEEKEFMKQKAAKK
jgi:hypothetical protein